MTTPNLISEVLKHATGAKSHIHGPGHWAGVAAAGYTLCKMTPEADPLVVLLFSVLHDAMRENNGHDPEHGARAAALARKLRDASVFQLDEARMKILKRALIHHDQGFVSEDATVGTCWDADRLCLWRLGRQPDPASLSTPAARTLTSRLASQAYGHYRFEWAPLFLNYDILAAGAVVRDLGGSPDPQLAGEDVYLRFGDLPEDGRSYIVAFMKFGREFGASAYPGTRSPDGTYTIDLRRTVMGPDSNFIRTLLALARPLYVVRGRHVGFGGGGEPLLDGAEIACEVAPEDFAGILPSHKVLEAGLAWWRAKRRGQPAGPMVDFVAGQIAGARPFMPVRQAPEGPSFGEVVKEGRDKLLERWGLKEAYEEMQRSATPPRSQPTPSFNFNQDFINQSYTNTFWREATWK